MPGHCLVIGLTGSIGMGKTTVTRQCELLGAHSCNADKIVHRLLAKDGAGVEAVGAVFPSVIKDGEVDRAALGAVVFDDKQKRRQLEQILHPMVVEAEEAFVHTQKQLGAKLIVLDIPLLFETGAQTRFDATIVVTAPYQVQKQRVMQRPGMTETKFKHILASQMPDNEKQQRADIIISTGLGRGYSMRQLREALGSIYET
jgi:dephospho-CoA kinase